MNVPTKDFANNRISISIKSKDHFKMKYSGKFFQVFSSIFSLICIAAAVFFMVYCTVQYCKNEDSSVIRFAEYNKNKDNIYPGITLCFRDYFKPDTFAENKAYFYSTWPTNIYLHSHSFLFLYLTHCIMFI